MKTKNLRVFVVLSVVAFGLFSLFSTIHVFAEGGGGSNDWCAGSCSEVQLKCHAMQTASGSTGSTSCCDGKYTDYTCVQIQNGHSCTEIKCTVPNPF